jgi:hypothetical protein
MARTALIVETHRRRAGPMSHERTDESAVSLTVAPQSVVTQAVEHPRSAERFTLVGGCLLAAVVMFLIIWPELKLTNLIRMNDNAIIVTVGTVVIALLPLLGAAVGLVNGRVMAMLDGRNRAPRMVLGGALGALFGGVLLHVLVFAATF